MKYLVSIIIIFQGLNACSQLSSDYLVKLALNSGVKQPVPQKFSSLVVKRPIKMDSLSLSEFHKTYIKTMTAGTSLLASGTLLVVAHIMIADLVPHFNRNLVIVVAAVGVTSFTAGGIVLPIGSWERHRYKKSLRIALAQRGL